MVCFKKDTKATHRVALVSLTLLMRIRALLTVCLEASHPPLADRKPSLTENDVSCPSTLFSYPLFYEDGTFGEQEKQWCVV